MLLEELPPGDVVDVEVVGLGDGESVDPLDVLVDVDGLGLWDSSEVALLDDGLGWGSCVCGAAGWVVWVGTTMLRTTSSVPIPLVTSITTAAVSATATRPLTTATMRAVRRWVRVAVDVICGLC